MAKSSNHTGEYWPGMVDALTNVVIAMIFVVVVLAIALSYSAQLAAKRMAEKMVREQRAAELVAPLPAVAAALANQQVVVGAPSVGTVTTRIAVTGPKPDSAGGTLTQSSARLILDFADEAVTLDDAAKKRLLAALAAEPEAVRNGRIQLVAQGPGMQLSENQRVAYLRVMAVRNLLIEQGRRADTIGVRIDTARETNSAMVSLSFEGAERR
jgi:hypothetical protein